MPPLTLGQKLLEWRVKRGLTQEEVGDLLRGVTAPTVGRWEKGQEIPGPVTICLEWLVEGKVPFQDLAVPQEIRDAVLKVSMDLEAWERLDALRIAGGYATVTDLLAGWIQEELNGPPEAKDRGWSEADTRTVGHAARDEMALLAEATEGVTTEVVPAAPLVDGAEAFLKKRAGAETGAPSNAPAALGSRKGPVRAPQGTPRRSGFP